jgi:hypothetical protein
MVASVEEKHIMMPWWCDEWWCALVWTENVLGWQSGDDVRKFSFYVKDTVMYLDTYRGVSSWFVSKILVLNLTTVTLK